MAGTSPENLGDGESFEDVTRIVRAMEAAHRRGAVARAKEVREQITREGIKVGVRPRPPKAPPDKRPKPATARPKPVPPPPADRAWTFGVTVPFDTGEYEVVRELSHAGAAIVYAAKRAGDSAPSPKFAIKALVPPLIWSAEETKARVKRFLNAAEVQQNVAAANPRGNWAPIHGAPVEVRGQGAYYVTDRFVRTADDLASAQREPISEEDLWWLVSGVVDGLEQLEKAADRPHGNLKSGNVLLARRKNQYRALLSDPLADGAAAAEAGGRAGDLHNLGDLIRRLVLRDSGGTDAATASIVGAEGAWARLGKTASAWRELCRVLLQKPDEYPTYEAIRQALWPLRVANANRNKKVMVIAATIVLAIGGTAWAAWPKTYQPQDWLALCRKWQWFDEARKDMFEYAKREGDQQLVKELSPDVSEFNPRQIALGDKNHPGGIDEKIDRLAELANSPPPPVSSQWGIGKTREALRLIDKLHAKMTPFEAWSVYKNSAPQLKGIAPYEPKLATALERTLAGSRPWIETESGEPPEGLTFLVNFFGGGNLSLARQLADLNQASARVEAQATHKEGDATVVDPFVQALATQVRIDVDESRLSTDAIGGRLLAGQQLLKIVLDKLGENAAARYDWARIAKDVDETTRLPGGEIGRRSTEAVNAWLDAVVPTYAFVLPKDNPTTFPDWPDAATFKKMVVRAEAAKGQPGANVKFREDLEREKVQLIDLAGEAAQLADAKFTYGDMATLKKRSGETLAELATRSESLAAIELQVRVDPKVWLPAIQAAASLKDIRSPAVNAFWTKQKNRLLDRYKDPAEFNTLYDEVHTKLELTAKALDGVLTPSQPIRGEEPYTWVDPLRSFEVRYREQQLAALGDQLLKLPASGDMPADFISGTRATWTAWQTSLTDWIRRGTALNAYLTPAGGLYAMDEPPADEKTPLVDSWRTWLAALTDSSQPIAAAFVDPDVKAAHAALQARYQTLTAVLGKSPPPAAVKAMLREGRPAEEAWAGWRAAANLGPPDWLTLTEELALRDATLKLAAKVPVPARATALNAQIVDSGRQRWLRRVKPPEGVEANGATTKPSDKWPAGLTLVEEAARTRDAFKVGRDATLDATARFNLRLAGLVAAARPLVDARTPEAQAAGNDKAKALLDAFLAQMDADASVEADPSVSPLVTKLREAKRVAEDPTLANRATKVPLSDDWVKVSADSDEQLLTYRNDKLPDVQGRPVELTFGRVEPSRGPPAFVLRNAVTIDQFSAVLPLKAVADAEIRAPALTDVGVFAKAEGDALHVTARGHWAIKSVDLNFRNVEPLDPSLRIPEPNGSLPMQFIYVSTATRWAASLGAGIRLPTRSEWQAAVDVETAAGTPTWNLRDSAWLQADAYFREKVTPPGANALALRSLAGVNPRNMARFGATTEDGEAWNADLTGPAAGQKPYADGAVLLLPAEPSADDRRSGVYGRTFYHVMGNVWQYVTDEADPTKYFVAGGSALSSPKQGYKVPIVHPEINKFGRYTDVGFRVAFEAPLQRSRTRMLAAVRAAQLFHEPATQ